MQVTPFLQRRELVAYCQSHGIVVQAYSPFCKGLKLNDTRLQAIAEAKSQQLMRMGANRPPVTTAQVGMCSGRLRSSRCRHAHARGVANALLLAAKHAERPCLQAVNLLNNHKNHTCMHMLELRIALCTMRYVLSPPACTRNTHARACCDHDATMHQHHTPFHSACRCCCVGPSRRGLCHYQSPPRLHARPAT